MAKVIGTIINENDFRLIGYYVEEEEGDHPGMVYYLNVCSRMEPGKGLVISTAITSENARYLVKQVKGISNAVIDGMGIKEKPGTKKFYDMPLYSHWGRPLSQGMSLVCRVIDAGNNTMGYEAVMYSNMKVKFYTTDEIVQLAKYIKPINFNVRKSKKGDNKYTIASRMNCSSLSSLPVKR